MPAPRNGSPSPRRLALIGAVLALAVTVTMIIVDGGQRTSDSATGPAGAPSAGVSTESTAPTTTRPTVAPTVNRPVGGTEVLPAGFTVKAGTAVPQQAPATPVVDGSPLSPDVLAQILHRLPNWSDGSDLGTDFRWPVQSLTKPTAGKTVAQTFPATSDSQSPPSAPEKSPSGPLHVLRMQPQGAVSVAPFVSITFDQPMVAVSTVDQLADDAVPAAVTPKIAGRWDWIGTETLRFTAESDALDRLPMATRYTVTVPAGTKSLSGGVLTHPATATFQTPAATVTGFTPGSKTPVSLHPVMVAVFNQLVDPTTVLRTVTVTAGGTAWPIRVATQAEIAADPDAAAGLSTAPNGRTVAFVPTRDFPAASPIAVTVRAGTKSAEGPLSSTSDAGFHFSTRAAMTLTGGSCTDFECQPGGPLQVMFSNPIDAQAFDPASVTVDPAIPGGASITADGTQITVSGATAAATAYRVTVRAGLRDTFGQTLAADSMVTITTSRATPRIYPFPTSVTTLDPMAAKPTVTITTVNQKRFRERVFAVQLADWGTYQSWLTHVLQLNTYQAGDNLHGPSWPVLSDRTVDVAGAGDQLAATVLDLSGALRSLPAGRTQVVVLIEPIDPVSTDDSWQNRPTMTWVQSTTLAVDAIADQSGLHAWVTDLRTGAPTPGASVTLETSGGSPVQPGVVTDSSGLAAIELTAAAGSLLVGTSGDQTVLLPADMWGSTWQASPQSDQLLWFVTDDRQTYRPGETVSVKGWIRRQAGDSTMALSAPATGSVSWSAVDGYGTTIGNGTATLGPLGGFDLALTIPAGAHLGAADLHLRLNGVSGIDYPESDHLFTVADFRTPAFEVQAHASTGDPAVRGTDVALQADASYYAGGPLADATVDWQVQTSTASYAPPGWSGYTFGVWTPWWYAGADAYGTAMPCCDNPAPDADVRPSTGPPTAPDPTTCR